MKLIKSRTWSIIGWTESLPENWQKKLKDSNLKIVVSPLHDSDLDEDTGEIQKAHYHIVVNWEGPTTLESAREFAEECGLGTYVERVRNMSNILDYLTHDSYSSKEKHQYDYKDIMWINCTMSDFKKIGYRQIIEYIKEHKIFAFNTLVDSLITENENDLLEFVSQKPYYVNLYLSSLKNKIDADIACSFSLLKGYADEIDKYGKFTLDRENYCKLLDVFEQLSIFADYSE